MVGELDSGKSQELFSYLLLHPDRAHSREALAAMLWGDASTAQSRKYLRQALWQLQTALEPVGDPTGSPAVLVEPEWIHINSDADIQLDVAEFEKAFSLVQGTPGKELDPEMVQTLHHALQLYQGDLLEGWYQDWCLYERERLQNMYLAMLDKLMGYCEVHAEYETALEYGMRILRKDRARERTHVWMMRLQYLAGDRTGALRQYERCVEALSEELDVQPAKNTVAMYEQIRADRSAAVTSLSDLGRQEPEKSASTLIEALGRVEQLGTILADMQLQITQLQREIQMVAVSRER